ncbi:hypothetical protein CAPTEDRAFT_197674 [Capitella teleta]|uniref:Uncharacterized protein n=1 Tax=Capitella teleta TaxID=283909 RepID=R7VGR2_CAPTE|nr:hypothetical protein CAPTEDRAFT_197674 [Capitella teleta]|eukprot:ELU18033.1 hypothetical protein CAPTEDRAFT_197674 [Capitella teleta]
MDTSACLENDFEPSSNICKQRLEIRISFYSNSDLANIKKMKGVQAFLVLLISSSTVAADQDACCYVAAGIVSDFSRVHLESLDRVAQTAEARYLQLQQSIQLADSQRSVLSARLAHTSQQCGTNFTAVTRELSLLGDQLADTTQQCKANCTATTDRLLVLGERLAQTEQRRSDDATNTQLMNSEMRAELNQLQQAMETQRDQINQLQDALARLTLQCCLNKFVKRLLCIHSTTDPGKH